MPRYSTPRRVWRIIYPPLIYISVSFVVIMLISGIYGGYLGASLASDGAGTFDAQYISDKVTELIANNAMLLQLVVCVVNLVIFAPMWRKANKAIPKYSENKITAAKTVLIVFAGIGLSLLIGSIITVANLTKYFPSYDNVVTALSGGHVLLQILTVVLIAPIVEEFCFRGVVLNRLSYWTPMWVAVVVQSALFGLIHLNLLQGMYAFALGIALSMLYIRFRNILIPIIGHMAFNSASYIANGFFTAIGVEEINTWIILIPSAAISGVCVWLLVKQPVPVAIPAEVERPANDAVPTGA